MSTFIYTAKRSLIPGHIADQTYTLDIEATSAPKNRTVDKSEVRAKGGVTETLYHSADTEWSITFEPVSGAKLDALTEFLHSTESGESFQMQIYNTSSSFVSAMRSDDGYALQEFMLVGAETRDLFQTSISVRAV